MRKAVQEVIAAALRDRSPVCARLAPIRDHSDHVFSLRLKGSIRTLECKATIAGVRNKPGDMCEARIAALATEDEAAA